LRTLRLRNVSATLRHLMPIAAQFMPSGREMDFRFERPSKACPSTRLLLSP